MRAAILGAGSLGTIMGALITKNGGTVTLIDANRDHVDAINKDGATIIGNLCLENIPVKAITPDRIEGVYDLVIVLLKQTANKTALTNLLRFLDKDSTVCTLQNGLPEPHVAEIIGAERTISGVVGWGASWVKPGVSKFASKPEALYVEISSLDGSVSDRVLKAQEFLRLHGEVRITSDLLGVRWSKLLMNAALSGMSAATGSTMGAVIDDDQSVLCAVHTADEVVRVAEALGISLPELVQGYDFAELKFDSQAGRDRAVRFARDFWAPHKEVKASMLNDMEKGIPGEIDYINGEVCKYGRKNGVATLFNDEIVRIVKEFESRKILFPSMRNTARFTIPVL